jgi:type I restriction enzyme M protein
VKKVAKTFHAFKDVQKYAHVVPQDDIEKNDFNLNISRYVDSSDKNVAAAVAKLRELEKERSEAEKKMNGYLAELGFA